MLRNVPLECVKMRMLLPMSVGLHALGGSSELTFPRSHSTCPLIDTRWMIYKHVIKSHFSVRFCSTLQLTATS